MRPSPAPHTQRTPHITFKDDRVVVHVRTHAKLGKALRGACVGVSLNTEADVLGRPRRGG